MNREYRSTDKENLAPTPAAESSSASEPPTKVKSSTKLALEKISHAVRARQVEKMNRLRAELRSRLGNDISGEWQLDCPGITET